MVLALCVVCVGEPTLRAAAVQPRSADHVAPWARLPAWQGLWQEDMSMRGGGGPPRAGGPPPAGGPPQIAGPPPLALPYNDAWQRRMAQTREQLALARDEEQIPDPTVTECSWGMPRIFGGPYQFGISLRPEQVFFDYDVLAFRHVWTDGRPHPASRVIAPSNSGHSIGRWEGDTLIIDTIGVRPLWLDAHGSVLSDQAHFVERWQSPSTDRLVMDLVIDDPVALRASYSVRHVYRRVTDTNRMLQQNCYENAHEVLEGDKVITRFGSEVTP